MTINNSSRSFRTAHGTLIDVLSPSPDVVHIVDIAASLAKQCRFAGHVRPNIDHYSVAQHSIMVSMTCDPENALIGLLHDGPEAYLQDIIRPNKNWIVGDEYRSYESLWARCIEEAMGLPKMSLVLLSSDIERADRIVCATELRDVSTMQPSDYESVEPLAWPIYPISAREAYNAFLDRYQELSSKST